MSSMKIWGLIRLTRPLNAAITFVSVWIAALLSAEFESLNWITVTMGAFAAGIIAAAGNIHNDIMDLEIDRINRPERPLPSGEVGLDIVKIIAALGALLGLVMGLFLGVVPFIITLAAALLLYFYNANLKMTVIFGNLTVSILTALAFIFGGVLAGNPAGGAVPAVFALFFHFSREMVKDIADAKGDSARRGKTFPMVYGILKAKRLAALVLALLIILIPLPYLAKMYKISYLLVCAIGVILPLMWVIYKLIFADETDYRKLSRVLKLGMAAGLIALYVGM